MSFHNCCRLVVLVLTLAIYPAAARAQCPLPTNLAANNTGCFVRLTWQNAPFGLPPQSWSIYRGEASDGSDAVSIGSTGASTFMYNDTPPVRDRTYYYFIRAIPVLPGCAPSTLDSAIVSGKLLEEAGFLVVTATPDCTGITLNWDPWPDATNFIVIRSENGNSNPIGGAPAGSTSYHDTTAIPGRRYGYGLRFNAPCLSIQGTIHGTQAVTMYAAPTTDACAATAVRNVGESVTFTFYTGDVPTATSTLGVLRDGQPVPVSPRFTYAANFSSMTITNIQPEDAGEYAVTASNPCGSVTQRAVLAVRANPSPPCRADFNDSGGLSVQDIFDFLNAWFAGCP